MKKVYFFLILTCTNIWIPFRASSQCTPVNCLAQLPAYGGVCNKSVQNGRVNQEYYDFASFHITSECVDAGIWDAAYTGVGAKVLKLHSFSISGLPAGMTMRTNQTEYSPPSNGCGGISGIPREAGLFKVKLAALINVRTWLVSSGCSGFLYLGVKNQPFDGTFSMLILPDAGFTGPEPFICIQDLPVTLSPTGTAGGTFSGPGVTGNVFNPSLAGAGTHQIKYEVTAQQGAAVSPAKNSSVQTIKVLSKMDWFADNDKDGFGNPLLSVTGCNSMAGYVTNDKDCNDDDPAIHPNTTDIFGNGIDENCDGIDGILSAIPFVSQGGFRWYPNPVGDFLVVESPEISGKTAIRIYSASGLILLEQLVSDRVTKLDIANFPTGVYLMLLSNSKGSIVSKLVKQ